ncbi:AmpG family muropeptide MFS transporter [Celerinatantimonas sp. MCCC 1A17872]|uniref:AmpG family muropeptide MFS transporter n=1 Tax=Celerinatantimonas sp. MCCC 1A17872 TaxID=3177514 RepID=UPI0038BF30D0
MDQTNKQSWTDSLKLYTQRPVLLMLSFGFSSGLPYLLVFSTFSFWLREAGVNRAEIGLISWVTLFYGLKWLWSPLVDRLPLPWLSQHLGRRRSWMLLAQTGIVIGLVGMSTLNPQNSLIAVSLFALVVSFSAATQDIVIDAFRIESAPEHLQAAMAAAYMTGYRLAMIVSGAGALWLAAIFSSAQSYQAHAWQLTYLCMAGLMAVGILSCLFAKEPNVARRGLTSITLVRQFHRRGMPLRLAGFLAWSYSALCEPFIDFWRRYRWVAVLILALISVYRIADVVMGVMASAFYVDMGFSKEQVASITKVFGVIMTLLGTGIGGILVNRLGTMRILFIGALLTAGTNLLYSYMATQPASLGLLTLVISADNLGAGIATAAFITYLSSLTNVAFSATQYALLSSIMLLFPKFIAGFSGYLVNWMGYNHFFTFTAILGIPALILIVLLARLNLSSSVTNDKR